MDETIFTDTREDKTQNAEPSNDTKTHSNNDDLFAVTPALESNDMRTCVDTFQNSVNTGISFENEKSILVKMVTPGSA